MEPLFVVAVVLGLSSSLHCIGMCGPIAMAVPVNRKNYRTIFTGLLQYNTGRILTYVTLGWLIGMVGLSIRTLGFLQWTSIVSGFLLILFAWRKRMGSLLSLGSGSRLTRFISQNTGRVLRSDFPFKLPLLGALNGLLPCGMVFVALTNAVLTGTPLNGALSMLLFGLGTLPAMLAVGFFAHRISSRLRTKFAHLTPYVLTVVGILVGLRGMNLDIPYISPKVSTQTEHLKESESDNPPASGVNMDCCHSSTSCE